MKHIIAALLLALFASEALAQRAYLVRRGRFIYVVNRPDFPGGGTPLVSVTGECRLDWRFAAPPALLEGLPKEPKGRFAAARGDGYQLLVPPGHSPGRAAGLVLFLGVLTPEESVNLASACQKAGLVLAVPPGMGDAVHAGVRLRQAVEVFDDVRRRLLIDTDRIYLAGTYGGAVTASRMAYTWPELCGGLLAVGATTSLRAEPYLRDRVRKRLSVVLMAGQLDAARHELERYRFPVLRDAELSAKMVLVPGRARGLPPAGVLEQSLLHLETGKAARSELGKDRPALRIGDLSVPTPEIWSKALLDEASQRQRLKLANDETLMLLHGLAERWPLQPAAIRAKKLLEQHDAKSPRKWGDVYNERQLAHFHREATAVDELYRTMAPIREAASLAAGLKAEAVRMWEQVDAFGPETKQGKRARARLEELRKAR